MCAKNDATCASWIRESIVCIPIVGRNLEQSWFNATPGYRSRAVHRCWWSLRVRANTQTYVYLLFMFVVSKTFWDCADYYEYGILDCMGINPIWPIRHSTCDVPPTDDELSQSNCFEGASIISFECVLWIRWLTDSHHSNLNTMGIMPSINVCIVLTAEGGNQ